MVRSRPGSTIMLVLGIIAILQDNGAQRYYIVLMEADYFLGGTSEDGDFPSRVDEIEGALKMTYLGFKNKSAGIDQFDTNRNRSLADDQVKFLGHGQNKFVDIC